jgi:hypothetical protein
MPANQHALRNPALQPLDVLSGQWNAEISEASFLGDLSKKISMQIAFEGIENGAFLAMRLPLDPPDSIWIIGWDDASDDYTVLYFDFRKISRIYHMNFHDGLWKMWRDSPSFSQRFEGTLSKDGNSIQAAWESSSDGKTWKHDFTLTYKRVIQKS